MKWIAAHKLMFGAGLLLAAAAAWYLHKRSSASTAAAGATAPDYGGVATSPYNDSAAPQFSFDLGSLLPQGPAAPVTTPGGSGGVTKPQPQPTPNKVDTTTSTSQAQLQGWAAEVAAVAAAGQTSDWASYFTKNEGGSMKPNVSLPLVSAGLAPAAPRGVGAVAD